MKHLHVSRPTNHDSTLTVLMESMASEDNDRKEKSSKKFFITEEILSINERLYMNFTEMCPLFLLKEGIDHRFEFLDFAPDLYIRQRFHPINHDEFLLNNTETQLEETNSIHTISTHVFSNKISQKLHPTTEIE